MISIEYSYLDEKSLIQTDIITIDNHDNNIERYTLPYNIASILPENLRRSYYNYKSNINLKLHAIDKPALIIKNNDEIIKTEWFKNGLNHREDGYSINNFNFIKKSYLFLNGLEYDSFIFAHLTNHLICRRCNKFCKQGCF